MTRTTTRAQTLFALALLALAGLPGTARAQDSEPAPPLSITSVTVTPESPAADTLCQLRIRLSNSGEETASQFGFAVKLNGQDLPVYGNQLFMYPVPAGGEEEIQLYNFWTTETTRPEMPKNGKFEVEVVLLEAEWMSIKMEPDEEAAEGDSEEGGEPELIETWRPLGAVDGLPVSRSVTLQTPSAEPTGEGAASEVSDGTGTP